MTNKQYINSLKQKQKILERIAYRSNQPICDRAYDECESECPRSVYDWDSSSYSYESIFKNKCRKACEEGRSSCNLASTSDKCSTFEDECESECPRSIYNWEKSTYYNTDFKRKCENACEEGKDACEG